MSNTYLQVLLDKRSKKYLTITTQSVAHLPLGISSSPFIFQWIMEGILCDISQCVVFLDDILLNGPTEAEHLKTLEEVLQQLEDHALCYKWHKCTFLQN